MSARGQPGAISDGYGNPLLPAYSTHETQGQKRGGWGNPSALHPSMEPSGRRMVCGISEIGKGWDYGPHDSSHGHLETDSSLRQGRYHTGTEDVAVLTSEFTDGVVACHDASWCYANSEVIGDNGTLPVDEFLENASRFGVEH